MSEQSPQAVQCRLSSRAAVLVVAALASLWASSALAQMRDSLATGTRVRVLLTPQDFTMQGSAPHQTLIGTRFLAFCLAFACGAMLAGEAVAQQYTPVSMETGDAFWMAPVGSTGSLHPSSQDETGTFPVSFPGESLPALAAQHTTMRDHVVPWAIEGAVVGVGSGLLAGGFSMVAGSGRGMLILGPVLGAMFGATVGAAWGVLEHYLGLPVYARF